MKGLGKGSKLFLINRNSSPSPTSEKSDLYFVMENRVPVTDENGEIIFFDTFDRARQYCEKLNFGEVCKILWSW